MKAIKPIALTGLAVVALAAVLSQRPAAHDLLVTGIVAAPLADTPGTVAVFAKIENRGGPDRLTGARSGSAGQAGLSIPEGSGGLAIPAESTPSLAPDGVFVRLTGLRGPLDDGRIIPVTLIFENSGEIRTKARIAAPRSDGGATAYGLFGIGDICRVGEGEPAPQISLAVKPDDTGWTVEVTAHDFEFTKDLVDGPHIPGTGHGHLYLNGLKLQRLYNPVAHIGSLPPGHHEVTVTLNTNDHRAYVVADVPVTASTLITTP